MISVNALVASAPLGLSFRAGAEHGDRLVTWAHAVDLPDPWRWVRPGDLVMTTGSGMPSAPAAQAEWIARLADARISALVVAPHPDAPGLSDALLSVAQARGLPVLEAGFELEFVRLARTVIESSLQSQRDRLAASQRLFETYAGLLREGVDFAGRLDQLSRRQRWSTLVVDEADGATLAGSGTTRRDDGAVTLQVPGRSRARLTVWPAAPGVIVHPLLAQDLAGVVGIELETQAALRDAEREAGRSLLRDLLDGRVGLPGVRAVLERRGLVGDLLAVAVAPAGTATRVVAEVHHAPAFGAIHPLLLVEGDEVVAVLPDDGASAQALAMSLGERSRVGLSRVLDAAVSVPESVHQARLALAHARELAAARDSSAEAPAGESGWGSVVAVRYAAGPDAPTLLPRSLAEATALTQRFLGPLIEHDRANQGSLALTLATFLDHDGSWKDTAAALHIHRQTLVYRLKAVEQLTGLKPTTTVGTASFWLALQAGRSVGLLPSGPPAAST